MLHKTDNLIIADSILRLLRIDKRLKHIDGLIKPYFNNSEYGFLIEFMKLKLTIPILFTVGEEQITVYLDNNILDLLNDNFEHKKVFSNVSFVEAEEYIASAVSDIIKNVKIQTPNRVKYKAL